MWIAYLLTRDKGFTMPERAKEKIMYDPGLQDVSQGTYQHSCLILVIDDDHAMASLLKDELSDEGCTVLQAFSGLEALAQVQGNSPNLIVTEMHLRLGGMEFLKKLKAACPLCPIIVVTAFGDASSRSRVLEAGMAGYFDKPVRMEALKALLCQYCVLPRCFHHQKMDWISPISSK